MLGVMIIVMVIQGQILDRIVCVSLQANTFWKGMSPHLCIDIRAVAKIVKTERGGLPFKRPRVCIVQIQAGK